MGSPLSCTIANFFMCHLENRILDNLRNKPTIYCRFVDDIFIVTKDNDNLDDVYRIFNTSSVLKFTKEMNINNKLPFLDVLINNSNNQKYLTSVYTKPTKTSECLNYNSYAPERYKTGVIKTLLSRATKICNTERAFEEEKQRIRRLLVNNNYPNRVCDKVINGYKFHNEVDMQGSDGGLVQSAAGDGGVCDSSADPKVVKIFFMGQFGPNYKIDEQCIREIIKKHVFQISVKLNLVIYYKSRKISQMLMKNNLSSTAKPDELKTHLVYRYTCNLGECRSSFPRNTYIGLTKTTLKERFSAHRYKGSIFAHITTIHGVRPILEKLLESVEILYHENDPFQLRVYEALYIRKLCPTLNENTSDFTCLTLNIF